MNGMKRRSLAALLLLVLGLPLVARSLGTTRPLAQMPLTPSRVQRYVFEPWTEEERAFYQTFQIAYALRGLAPLERWEQELLSADSLLKAAQAELADSISVFRGAVRALEEEHMAASEEGPSPELSAALTRLEALLESLGQLQSRLWDDERELQRLLYVDDVAVARRDSMQRWRDMIVRALLPYYGTWQDAGRKTKFEIRYEANPDRIELKSQFWQRSFVLTNRPVPPTLRWGGVTDATTTRVAELQLQGNELRASLLFPNGKELRLDEGLLVLRRGASPDRLSAHFCGQDYELQRVGP